MPRFGYSTGNLEVAIRRQVASAAGSLRNSLIPITIRVDIVVDAHQFTNTADLCTLQISNMRGSPTWSWSYSAAGTPDKASNEVPLVEA